MDEDIVVDEFEEPTEELTVEDAKDMWAGTLDTTGSFYEILNSEFEKFSLFTLLKTFSLLFYHRIQQVSHKNDQLPSK